MSIKNERLKNINFENGIDKLKEIVQGFKR